MVNGVLSMNINDRYIPVIRQSAQADHFCIYTLEFEEQLAPCV